MSSLASMVAEIELVLLNHKKCDKTKALVTVFDVGFTPQKINTGQLHCADCLSEVSVHSDK